MTKKWAKQRKAEERSTRLRPPTASYIFRPARYTIKEAAYEIMETAYLEASGNGQLPGQRPPDHVRRPRLHPGADGRTLGDDYFTQSLLPDYIEEYRRGLGRRLRRPRPLHRAAHQAGVPLGTLSVRAYLGDAAHRSVGEPGGRSIRSTFPTKGPANRFGAVLFIEKEGFAQILKAARIAERYDIAVMSTKGMSVTASRLLVDHLSVPLLVLHDFDQSGFSILGTLRTLHAPLPLRGQRRRDRPRAHARRHRAATAWKPRNSGSRRPHQRCDGTAPRPPTSPSCS